MSLISSINIAQQALLVNQSALSVVSNNIANVDTDGYSKLKVNLASVINYTPSSGDASTNANSLSGVQISDIKRYSDAYLQSYYWQQNSGYTYANQYASTASSIENLTNELNTTGLATAFSKFFEAANALSDTPSDATARVNYEQAASNVCSVFNSISSNLSGIGKSLVGDGVTQSTLQSSQIYSSVGDVNQLLSQLADVNKDIIKTNPNNEISTASSSLLDQRDSIITKLSSLMPVNVSYTDNGMAKVSLGDTALVSGQNVVGHLDIQNSGDPSNPVTISVLDNNNKKVADNVNDLINSGTMGAVLDVCGSDTDKLTINGVQASLDKLASGFANILNTIQTGDPNNKTGDPTKNTTVAMAMDANNKLIKSTENLFVSSDASTSTITAGNISVNSAIVNNKNLIAASRISTAEYDAGKYQDETGNNSNMALVSSARSTSYSELGNTTIEGCLSNAVGNVATKVESINSSLKSQTSVLSSVKTQLNSETGVNLDEELSDLIKYQRAYQAAARIFTTCSDLMQELVNLGQ